jgi:hypothetical protein
MLTLSRAGQKGTSNKLNNNKTDVKKETLPLAIEKHT